MNFVVILVNFLHNASAILGALFLYRVFVPRLRNWPKPLLRVADGLFFGAVALLSMTDPVTVGEGVFFDLRGVIIGVATAYYGLLTGSITALIVCVIRLLVGGPGAIPSVGIALTNVVIGQVFFAVYTQRQRSIPIDRHILLGVLLAVQINFWSLFLPPAAGASFREQVFLPLIVSHALAALSIGLMLHYQQQNTEMSETLERERDLLRGLIEATPDYIFVKDEQGRFIVSNIAHARAARVATPEALIGKTAEQVFPPELAAQYRADDENVLKTGETITVERQTVDANRQTIWVTTIKGPLRSASGKVIGVIGISRNITKRKDTEDKLRKSEARYRQIIETAHEGVWIVNRDQQSELVNPHLANMLGYTIDELKNKSVFDLVAPEAQSQIDQNIERRKQGFSDQYDSKLVCKDGTVLDVIISASPRFDDAGNYVGALAMITDVSDRKLAERQEQELGFERERLKMMRSFINSVSHDFRTPLATLNTSMYLLRRITDDDKREDRLNLIEAQINRLTVLLDAFTEVAQLGDGTQNLLMTVDLNEMVNQAVETYQEAAARKYQHITFRPMLNLPSVQAVPEHLQRVLRELLDNAIFFTPEGGLIEVRTCTHNDQVIIEVEDNGIGIDAEDMPYIFDYFYRADRSRQTSSGGPGLGLSLARNIIENHKGRIEVKSTPGEGSIFRVLLPLPSESITFPQSHSSLMKWH
jgi:PAS domain S-box-containing protein